MGFKKIIFKLIRRVFSGFKYKMRKGVAAGFYRRFGYGSFPEWGQSLEEKFINEVNLSHLVIYDIGAYIGLFSMFFAKVSGSGSNIYSFEPNKNSYYELTENLKLNNLTDVSTYNVAIGQQNGELNLSIDSIYPARSTFENNGGVMKTKGHAKNYLVSMYTLDSFIEQNNILKPDFIKIDVEGYEAQVIEGMNKLIKSKKPCLYIELHSDYIACKVINSLIGNYKIFHIERDKYLNLNNTKNLTGHIYCK